jgi:ABC-type nickel/cobalt efflux system permease component RcnA
VRSAILALPGALVILALLTGAVSAHPLGNFTINHYARLRIEPRAVVLDVVIDRAEIPAFQELRRLDLDGDGALSPTEADAARVAGCLGLASSLRLSLGGAPTVPELTAAGLSLPTGAGGLPTMRLVCTFGAALEAPLAADTPITFTDESDTARLGWREIVVEGDGVSIAGSADTARDRSARLTAYPAGGLEQPLAMRGVSFTASPGGPALPPLVVPDAEPLGDGSGGEAGTSGEAASGTAASSGAVVSTPAAGGELATILQASDTTPAVVLLAIVAAMALGAGHALTPGHGKTLMAVALVGARGTPAQAVGLGLSVTVAHTLGILLLAFVVVGAGAALPPEAFARIAPLVSAVSVLGIGVWMVAGHLRRGSGTPGQRHEHTDGGAHGHPHGHVHGHAHQGSVGEDPAEPGVGRGAGSEPGHSHDAPPPHGRLERGLRWRGLFALGLAGGIVPSVSALIILLATIAAGATAWGIVLVVAFGLGMAVTLTGLGLAIVVARDRVEHVAGRFSHLGRALEVTPVAASLLVLATGLYLAAQAVTGLQIG